MAMTGIGSIGVFCKFTQWMRLSWLWSISPEKLLLWLYAAFSRSFFDGSFYDIGGGILIALGVCLAHE
jgi:hypothetical protein